eukprot:8184596-Alexandrium_andersonii.AAC.1
MFEKSRTRRPVMYPFLNVKAAHGRHCAEALLVVCRSLTLPRSFDHPIASLAGLEQFYRAVNEPVHYLSPANLKLATDGLNRFLVHYQLCARQAFDAGEQFFYLTEKRFHYPAHLALLCKFLNPRKAWTYADEDFVGRIGNLCAHTIKGLGP